MFDAEPETVIDPREIARRAAVMLGYPLKSIDQALTVVAKSGKKTPQSARWWFERIHIRHEASKLDRDEAKPDAPRRGRT